MVKVMKVVTKWLWCIGITILGMIVMALSAFAAMIQHIITGEDYFDILSDVVADFKQEAVGRPDDDKVDD